MPTTVPVEVSDPVNARILAVSEDRIQGFHERPFDPISRLSGVDLPVDGGLTAQMAAAVVSPRIRAWTGRQPLSFLEDRTP